jgi:signal transduction histidine kinase
MRGAASITKARLTGTFNNKMIATMRLVLASSALLIVYLDPSEPDRLIPVTYATLILYTAYCAALFTLAGRESRTARSIEGWAHWLDVGWYLLLISLSSGTSSIFFFFFFFSILVASFRWGFRSGLSVVLTSSILFTVIGYVTAPAEPEFELNRFLLRPMYLLVLGYMMAYLGGTEVTLKRRLELLKDISSLSNPRFGVHRTLGVILERLRAHYDADNCLLILTDRETGDYTLRSSTRSDPEAGIQSHSLTTEAVRSLLALPADYAVVYSCKAKPSFRLGPKYLAYDASNDEWLVDKEEEAEGIAEQLDAQSYVSVPLRFREESLGRLYITSKRPKSFRTSDMDFLLQAVDQFMPVIENIRLVDRLASDAAEQERKRIARDIHDSIIQPYIGLQLGLESLDQPLDSKLGPDCEQWAENRNVIRARIERLRDMTAKGIDDLRHYVRGLATSGGPEAGLLPSVRRFVNTFSDVTGIDVKVEAVGEIRVNDRLAAEVFQLINEGLSNIRRHTRSNRAQVRLSCSNGSIMLEIENDLDEASQVQPFKPRSISERAKALGGSARVERRDDSTAVVVDIPL